MRTQLVHVARHSLAAALLVASISSTAAAQALPAPWVSADIGAPAMSGSATHSQGTFTINAAGSDIWRERDQFHFVYQAVTGNVEIVARVASISRAHEWSKSGVMIRESLAADSRHAMIVASAAMGYSFQRRVDTGSGSRSTSGPSTAPPGWVRLVRTGDLFQAYQSTDGVTWRLVGSETILMGETVYVGLPATSHNVSARTTAVINNVRVTSASQPNQPPAVSITSPASAAQYMAPATVNISATASDREERLLSVDFYVDSTMISRDTTAPYAATWSATAAGTHSLTAVAHDADGGSTTSAAVSITVRTNGAPVVSLTSPTNGATASAPASFNLAATASDPEGQLARVEFFAGTTRLSSDTSSPYAFSWTSVPAGTYSLTAVAYDAAGNSTTSGAVAVTVTGPSGGLPGGQQNRDIGSPAIAGSTGFANGVYTIRAAGSDIWRDSDQFQFVYRQVTGDTELIARVSSISNANAWSKAGVMVRETLAANSPNAFMLTSAAMSFSFQRRLTAGAATTATHGSAAVSPGWVRLVRRGNVFQAYQSANGSAWTLVGTSTVTMASTVYVGLAVTSHNVSAATTAVIDNFNVVGPGANQPPTVSLTSPANGASMSAPATISLAANASDPENQLARVEFFNGTTLLGSDTSAPYSFSWTNVAAGTYTLSATAYDTAGALASSTAVTVTVTGSNGAPAVALTSPTSGASMTAPATINMTANASDPENQLARVEFYSGSTLLNSDTSAPYSWSWTNVAAGTYTLTAAAFDSAGNRTNSSPVTVTVTSNGAPTVSLTSPASGATFTAPATVNIAANASDPENQLARVEFYRGTTLLGSDTSAPYSFSWTNVAAGTYTLTASAFDTSGNRTNSAAVTVTVNANGAPSAALTSPSNGATFTAPATINIAANASDPEGQLNRVEFYRGTTLLGSDTSAPFSFSWSNVAAGTYTLTAAAFDAAGNRTNSTAVTVTVTTPTSTPPRQVVFTASSDHAANVTSYRLDVFTSGANPSTATPVATANLGKPTPNASNDITVDQATLFSNLAPGNYIATVTAIGPGGSTRSATVAFTR